MMVRGSTKARRNHGRSRARRRRAALLLLALVAALLILPVLAGLPDAVRRATHPLRYEETIRAVSEEYGLEPTLVAGVVYAESRFRPDARSSQGAYGLMQVLPETADFISERGGIRGDYRDPEVNLRMGAWYLSYLEGRFSGNERLVLAAYNSGEGRVDEWTSDEGFDVAEDIPFRETRDYVENVLEARRTYAELYGRNLDRHQE